MDHFSQYFFEIKLQKLTSSSLMRLLDVPEVILRRSNSVTTLVPPTMPLCMEFTTEIPLLTLLLFTTPE